MGYVFMCSCKLQVAKGGFVYYMTKNKLKKAKLSFQILFKIPPKEDLTVNLILFIPLVILYIL